MRLLLWTAASFSYLFSSNLLDVLHRAKVCMQVMFDHGSITSAAHVCACVLVLSKKMSYDMHFVPE